MQKLSRKKGIPTEELEHKWDKAKEIAAKAGKHDNYAYVTGIFKKMVGEEYTDNRSAHITRLIGDSYEHS
jgi:YesN/AraC family two-component response regulator